MNRRHHEAALRFAERRRREDESPRLRDVVPTLESLELKLGESRSGVRLTEVSHTRRIVVERAPALFEVPCQDPSCKDGGHDLTADVLRALRSGAEDFEGQDICAGQVGTGSCQRVLSYVATATYRR